MATTTEPQAPPRCIPGDNRIVIRDVDWETFQRLHAAIGDHQHVRIAYNQGVLELMSPGIPHEDWKALIDRMIDIVTEELDLPCRSLASVTWKRPETERAIEADDCYYLTAEKIAASAHGSKDIADYPTPDLAFEIDVRRSPVDRPSIYAALGVPEIWRFDGQTLHIDRLRDDGTYEERPESRFLPITPEEVARWVLEVESHDQTAWARQLRAWVRAEIVPRAGRGRA